MVDAIVTSLLEQLTSVAAKEGAEQVRLVVGVEKEVSKLQRNLGAIRAVLADAEQRQMKEEAAGIWLEQLKYASHDMEDVLDEWNTARLKLQIQRVGDDDDKAIVPDYQKKKKKVCSCLPTYSFGFKRVFLRHDIAFKIKEINERLDDIVKQKDMFNISKGTPEKLEHETTISSIDVTEISGRDIEKKSLISKLVSESNAEGNNLHIISLVGMGGIGKTTLAQLVYNDDDVKRNFEKRIWVCVSDTFDEFRIARAIIEGLGASTANLQELQSLAQQIEELIEGKKFFLVLDDMWNENYSKFEKLYNCLKNGNKRSKILITTRKEIVARKMRSVDVITIKELQEQECWSLFKRLAFFGWSGEECEKLEEIGQKIVGKCNGLPLAVKTIGSLLCYKKTEQEWQVILNSEMWELEELEQGLLAPLLLSYNELPYMVKRCFQYCATFPKNHEIEKNQLIKLWMAQGYLNVKGNQEMEKIGQLYFNILATHSFFQEFEKDEDDDNVITSCKMHDIVHDFAQYVCKHESLTKQVNGDGESFKDPFGEKVHHLMLQIGNEIPIPTSIYRAKKLWSLLIHYTQGYPPSMNNDLSKLFSKLTCLRAFNISCRKSDHFTLEVPREIGKLIHLRFLNLCRQNIEKLPETLCELYNLQTLDISYCKHLKELPQGIGKLINMKYLENEETDSLKHMPAGIARLTGLQTLKKLVVGGDGSVDGSKTCTLESLKDLNLLQDQCRIEGLGYVKDVGEAERSQLEKKKKILFLVFNFGYGLGEPPELKVGRRKNEEDEKVLEDLQPPLSLKGLSVSFYKGKKGFPNWLMSLTNLRRLELQCCSNCEHLPALGKLPSLEQLSIWECSSVKRVGNEFLGILESDHHGSSSSSSVIAFPKLKFLDITGMYGLEEWEYENIIGKGDIIIMPCLSSLALRVCPKLKKLPVLGKLPSLEELSIINCQSVKRIGNEFLGILESDHHGSSSSSSVIAFPELKSLSIYGMDELEEWKYENITGKGDIIIMPRLSSLLLLICPKLKMLPDQLLQKTTLQHLILSECPILTITVDRSKISHIPDVHIW